MTAESSAGWLTETLSTITSNAFTEVTIWISPSYTPSEHQVCEWNAVDNVLDRLNPSEDVTLVVKPLRLVVKDKFEDSIRVRFPLMWKSGRVVLEASPLRWGGG